MQLCNPSPHFTTSVKQKQTLTDPIPMRLYKSQPSNILLLFAYRHDTQKHRGAGDQEKWQALRYRDE